MEEKLTAKKAEFLPPEAEVRRFGVKDVVRTSISMPKDPYGDFEDDEDI